MKKQARRYRSNKCRSRRLTFNQLSSNPMSFAYRRFQCLFNTVHTKQMDFQTLALDKFVITQKDFNNMGKERFKKTPTSKCQKVVFCLLCKARMIQKKLHPTQKLAHKKKMPSSDVGTPRQPKKGKIVGPLAGLLPKLRNAAAYHCQTIVFTVVNKNSDKTKHARLRIIFMETPGRTSLAHANSLSTAMRDF